MKSYDEMIHTNNLPTTEAIIDERRPKMQEKGNAKARACVPVSVTCKIGDGK